MSTIGISDNVYHLEESKKTKELEIKLKRYNFDFDNFENEIEIVDENGEELNNKDEENSEDKREYNEDAAIMIGCQMMKMEWIHLVHQALHQVYYRVHRSRLGLQNH